MYDDIEKMLRLDSISKKKSGRGVFNRASRLGYCKGGVKFPSDFLSNKEKRKLNGEVKVKSMYTEINNLPTVSELKKMNIEKAMMIMQEARNNFTNIELTKHFSVSSGKLYTLFDIYGVEYKRRGDYTQRKGKKEANKLIKELSESIKREPISEVISIPKEKQNGITITLSGTYSKEDLEKKLHSIANMLDDKEYTIECKISEV